MAWSSKPSDPQWVPRVGWWANPTYPTRPFHPEFYDPHVERHTDGGSVGTLTATARILQRVSVTLGGDGAMALGSVKQIQPVAARFTGSDVSQTGTLIIGLSAWSYSMTPRPASFAAGGLLSASATLPGDGLSASAFPGFKGNELQGSTGTLGGTAISQIYVATAFFNSEGTTLYWPITATGGHIDGLSAAIGAGPATAGDVSSGQLSGSSISQIYSPAPQFASSGSLSATAKPVYLPVVLMTGTGALTAASYGQRSGSPTFNSVGTLSMSFTVGYSAPEYLAGAGQLAGTSTQKYASTWSLASQGSLSATVTQSYSAAPQLTSDGALSSLINSSGDGLFATAVGQMLTGDTATSNGNLAASVSQIYTRPPALAGSGALASSQFISLATAPAFSSTGTLTTTVVPQRNALPSMSGGGTLTATAVPQRNSALTLSGSGAFTPTTTQAYGAPVTINSTGTLAAAAYGIYSFTPQFNSQGFFNPGYYPGSDGLWASGYPKYSRPDIEGSDGTLAGVARMTLMNASHSNIVCDPGWETLGTSTAYKRSGTKSYVIIGNGVSYITSVNYNVSMNSSSAAYDDCTPGQQTYAETWVMGDPANVQAVDGGTTWGVGMFAEFIDSTGINSTTWAGQALLTTTALNGIWTKIGFTYTVPAGYNKCRVWFGVGPTCNNGEKYYFDDPILQPLNLFQGGGTLAATTSSRYLATGNASSAGSLTASTVRQYLSPLTLTGSGALVATGSQMYLFTAPLTGAGALTQTNTHQYYNLTAATLSGSGAITAGTVPKFTADYLEMCDGGGDYENTGIPIYSWGGGAYSTEQAYTGTHSWKWTAGGTWNGPFLRQSSQSIIAPGQRIDLRTKIKPHASNTTTAGYLAIAARFYTAADNSTYTDSSWVTIANSALSAGWNDLNSLGIIAPAGALSVECWVLSSPDSPSANMYYIDAASVRINPLFGYGVGNLSAATVFPAHAPQADAYSTAGAYSYTIPWWADAVDIVCLGGGGGGNKGGAIITGTGGLAGAWLTVTMTRGSGIPWATTTITGTVGSGGGGDADGTATTATATGMTSQSAAGGAHGSYTGQKLGQGAGTRSFDGQTYTAGGDSGSNGTSPGGGGAGGNAVYGGGGSGATGEVWFYAYQTGVHPWMSSPALSGGGALSATAWATPAWSAAALTGSGSLTATAVPAGAHYTDNFNRANSTTSLGAGWTNRSSNMGIYSNTAYCPGMYVLGAATYDTSLLTDNMSVSVTGTGSVYPMMGFLGCNTVGQGACIYVTGTTVYIMYQDVWANIAVTYPVTNTAPANNNGDVFTLSRTGNVYTTKRNGVAFGSTWTDSGNIVPRNSTHRLCGVGAYGYGSGLLVVDAWAADDI